LGLFFGECARSRARGGRRARGEGIAERRPRVGGAS
jgi:hypothetical protein